MLGCPADIHPGEALLDAIVEFDTRWPDASCDSAYGNEAASLLDPRQPLKPEGHPFRIPRKTGYRRQCEPDPAKSRQTPPFLR